MELGALPLRNDESLSVEGCSSLPLGAASPPSGRDLLTVAEVINPALPEENVNASHSHLAR